MYLSTHAACLVLLGTRKANHCCCRISKNEKRGWEREETEKRDGSEREREGERERERERKKERVRSDRAQIQERKEEQKRWKGGREQNRMCFFTAQRTTQRVCMLMNLLTTHITSPWWHTHVRPVLQAWPPSPDKRPSVSDMGSVSGQCKMARVCVCAHVLCVCVFCVCRCLCVFAKFK